MKRIRRWLIWGGLALVLLIGGGLLVLYTQLNGLIKRGVEHFGPVYTGTSVTLDEVRISPFSGSGRLAGLTVGNPEGWQTDRAFLLGSLSIRLQPKSVTTDTVVIEELLIEGPEITYELGLKGGSNLEEIKAHLDKMTSQEPKPEETPGKKVVIERLVIAEAKVRVSASFLGGKTLTVPLPRIEKTGIGKTAGQEGGADWDETIALVVDSLLEVVKPVGNRVRDLGADAVEKVGELTSLAATSAGTLLESAKGVGENLGGAAKDVGKGIGGLFGGDGKAKDE